MSEKTLGRFQDKIANFGGDGCWLWTGATSWGYGKFRMPGVKSSVGAHRVSYELFVGDIPAEFEIDHLCENRPCVNPEHLQLLSKRDNVLKMMAKYENRGCCRLCKRPLLAEPPYLKHNNYAIIEA